MKSIEGESPSEFESRVLRSRDAKPNAVCSTPTCPSRVYKRPNEKNKYCSNDCRATNFVVKIEIICPQCKQDFKRTNRHQVHCSRTCSNVARKGTTYMQGSPRSKVVRVHKLRNALISIFGEKCSICSIGPIWNDKHLTLQVDHINGDNKDDRIENIRLLCPNCHTQTDTFAGRNISNKRNQIKTVSVDQTYIYIYSPSFRR